MHADELDYDRCNALTLQRFNVPLNRLVGDRDAAEDHRVALRGEIKEFEHRSANDPLIAHERLDHVGIGVARRDTNFPVPNFASK